MVHPYNKILFENKMKYHHIHIVVQAQTAVNFRALSSPLKLLPIGGLSPSAHWQPWVAFYLRGSVCSGRFMYLESHNMRSSWRASVWLRFLILRFIHSAACVSTSFYFQTVFYCKDAPYFIYHSIDAHLGFPLF